MEVQALADVLTMVNVGEIDDGQCGGDCIRPIHSCLGAILYDVLEQRAGDALHPKAIVSHPLHRRRRKSCHHTEEDHKLSHKSLLRFWAQVSNIRRIYKISMV